jgi:uncharacterized protein (TIRG00374 family)
MQLLRKIAPFVISLALLFIIARLAPWGQVIEVLDDINPLAILALVALSAVYYIAKILRFWYMLRILGIKEPLGVISWIYLAAQPVSLLPAGELFRAKALETYRDIPMAKAVPTFTAQGLMEGVGIAVVGVASALTLGTERLPALILAVVVVLSILGIRLGYLAHLTKLINAIPFVSVSRVRLTRFSKQNQALFSGWTLWILAFISVGIELVGVAIAYVSVAGLSGHLNLFQAALFYIVPLIVSFISFLPGGLGASEQSAIGLLLLMGQTSAIAVAATLIMRVAIVVTGLVYGVIALVAIKLNPTLVHKPKRIRG